MLNTSGCAFSTSSNSTTRVGLAAHRLGQLAALLVAHVSRRRADQAGDRVFLHVFASCRCAPCCSRRRTAPRPAPWPARFCPRRSGPGTGSEPMGRFGSWMPARERRMASDTFCTASSWPMTRLMQDVRQAEAASRARPPSAWPPGCRSSGPRFGRFPPRSPCRAAGCLRPRPRLFFSASSSCALQLRQLGRISARPPCSGRIRAAAQLDFGVDLLRFPRAASARLPMAAFSFSQLRLHAVELVRAARQAPSAARPGAPCESCVGLLFQRAPPRFRAA